MAGERDDLERRHREIASLEVDPVTYQRPPPSQSHVVKYSRGPATHVHGSEPCEFGTPERAVDDRHEVDITPARAKRSHAR